MIKVENIDVCYDKIKVLYDVSIAYDGKGICGIIGANGAGKTTLLQAIAGLNPPTSGTIQFEGKKISELPSHKVVKMGISYIPDREGFFPYLTVSKNLELGFYSLRGGEKKKQTLEEIFELFPSLYERKNVMAKKLSGGEQRMLALGMGLMAKPKLLLIDEPSSGLAPKIIEQLYEIIWKLSENGIGILLVEQDVHRCLDFSKIAYLMEEGKIALRGESKKLLQNNYIRKAYLGI